MKYATTISIDRDTRARLGKLAGDMPVATYLRELSKDLSGEQRVKLEDIDKKLDQLVKEFKKQSSNLSGPGMVNKRGVLASMGDLDWFERLITKIGKKAGYNIDLPTLRLIYDVMKGSPDHGLKEQVNPI